MSETKESVKNLVYEVNNLVPCEKIGITIHIGLCVISITFLDLDKRIKLGKIARYNTEPEKMQSISGGFSQETEDKLNKSLWALVNNIIDDFFNETHYSCYDVIKLVFCCPTAVERILLKERFMSGDCFNAYEMGINVSVEAEVYIMPFVSSEIGGDITAEILALPKGKSSMILSLETDTKIAYIGEKTACCSVPQCAFFDGVGYENGMPATKGAIESVWRGESGEICYSVAGDCSSVGIAPCAVIESLKLMLDEGITDGDGTMTDRDLLYIGEDYFVSQATVRAAQTAKARLFSTLKAFMNELDTWENDIETVFISGMFTKKLQQQILFDLSFLPKFPKAKFAFTQDASEIGMSKVLFGEATRENIRRLSEKFEVIREFDDEFLDAAYMAGILF